MARPRLLRKVEQEPPAVYYKPQGIPMRDLSEITLSLEGFEAVRLVDFLAYSQEKAAKEMGVSKATVCRVLANARKTIAAALTQGYALRIAGGNYILGDEVSHKAFCQKNTQKKD